MVRVIYRHIAKYRKLILNLLTKFEFTLYTYSMPGLTQEQIIALAPDPGSAKAGKELASPRKWVLKKKH